jgi:hypothetical protein
MQELQQCLLCYISTVLGGAHTVEDDIRNNEFWFVSNADILLLYKCTDTDI